MLEYALIAELFRLRKIFYENIGTDEITGERTSQLEIELII